MTRYVRRLDINPLTRTRSQTTLEQDLERSLRHKVSHSVLSVGPAWERELAELAHLLEDENGLPNP